jgi:outer membrane protein assembly factor BamB
VISVNQLDFFTRHLFVFIVFMAAMVDSLSAAEDWPRFRGVNGAGISSSSEIPSEWTEDDYKWVADLPGSGNSSPVIWQNQIYVTAADEKSQRRFLICINKSDGNEQWRAEVSFSKYKTHKNNNFASSTPAVDGEHVYQLWHSPDQTSLIAYDHAGEEVWRYELGSYKHGQGGATSPIVAGDLVVVAHDHSENSFLVAVDAATGKERWKVPREGKRACYSTPCVRTTAADKQELVFVHCYEGVIGLDSETGQQNWHIDPFGRESQRALASPIVAENLVIAGSGAIAGDRQMVAIDIDESGDKVKATEAYHLIKQSPHVPSPLVIGDRLYLWNDGGIATCCELARGDVIWQNRVGGNYFSSPIAIGDRIFSIDTTGEVVVIAANDKFKVLARNSMGESSRASMATSDNVLFVRTDTKLFAIGH